MRRLRERPEWQLFSILTRADRRLGLAWWMVLVARGPPLAISMDMIAAGLIEMLGGLASAVVLFAFRWWAPLVLAGAWLATHWLLRESAVWKDRRTEEVRSAQRDSDYAYRLAVDPP